MTRNLFAYGAVLLGLAPAPGAAAASEAWLSWGGRNRIHSGVYEPQDAVADLLFLHGYGDRFENHEALFAALNRQGVRVLTFDLPSHGRTTGRDLEASSFSDLARMALAVERKYRPADGRPLFAGGWSLGGLLAVRMAQDGSFDERRLSGLVLWAPAISVPLCVGEGACEITNRTLTHDPALQSRPLAPAFPLARPGFGLRLLREAHLARSRPFPPEGMTALVFVAGQEDRYVKSQAVADWSLDLRNRGADVSVVQCPTAFHELDNETAAYGGPFVREAAAAFVASGGATSGFPWSPACHSL